MSSLDLIIILTVFIILFVLILLTGIGIFFWLRRRVLRLGKDFVDATVYHIGTHVKKLPKVQQLLEYNSILDDILSKLGYKGTLTEKLQQYETRLSDPETIWKAHDENNKILLEASYTPHEDTDRHVVALEKEVTRILQQSQKLPRQ